eukprot:11480456-Alexandrium_andersonii.AAC.1
MVPHFAAARVHFPHALECHGTRVPPQVVRRVALLIVLYGSCLAYPTHHLVIRARLQPTPKSLVP